MRNNDGKWFYHRNVITISDYIVIDEAWSTMYHEMIHQYLDQILDVEESNPHGPIFCETFFMFAQGKFSEGLK
jgi:hypothetical protein